MSRHAAAIGAGLAGVATRTAVEPIAAESDEFVIEFDPAVAMSQEAERQRYEAESLERVRQIKEGYRRLWASSEIKPRSFLGRLALGARGVLKIGPRVSAEEAEPAAVEIDAEKLESALEAAARGGRSGLMREEPEFDFAPPEQREPSP